MVAVTTMALGFSNQVFTRKSVDVYVVLWRSLVKQLLTMSHDSESNLTSRQSNNSTAPVSTQMSLSPSQFLGQMGKSLLFLCAQKIT
jgi:hypothetical protein